MKRAFLQSVLQWSFREIDRSGFVLYWEFHEGKASKQAARMGRWKGVRLSPDGPLELYDLEADIGEEDDVADEHPEIVGEIEEYLGTARTESEAWPLRVADGR